MHPTTNGAAVTAAELDQLRERITQLERQLAHANRTAASTNRSEQRYRVLADSMPQLVWATDPDGYHVYYNQRWYDYTGLSEQESLGFGFALALHPDDKAPTLARWEQAWRDGASYEVEYRFRGRDGVYRWFIGRAQPVRDADGAIIEWVGTCTEIDEQKRAREGLALLAEASSILASSLDYEETLASLAMVAVPGLADWCAVDLLAPDGTLDRLAVAHIDPDKVALADEIYRRWPPDMSATAGAPQVIRTGSPELVPEITEAMVREGITDPELRDIFLRIGMRSLMTVPLKARDQVFGTITLASAESGRHFGPQDLSLAEEVARRAAVAIDHARLVRDLRVFRATLDRTHDCVFMCDAETLRFVYVNQGALDQVGYSADELLHMTVLQIKTEFTEAGYRAMLAPLVSGELAQHTFETTHRHKDGRLVPVEVSIQYVDPPEGDPRFVAVVRDITERKRVEAELRRQATVLAEQARLIDLAHEAIIVRDISGRISLWNRGAEELYGYSAAEAIGSVSHALLKTQFVSEPTLTSESQDLLLDEGQTWEGELGHVRADGQLITVESRQIAVADSAGGPTQVLEINRDVTARKVAEAALRASEERYRALIDAMPLLIWIADNNGVLISANEPWQSYTGLTAEAAREAGWHTTIHESDLPHSRERWRQSVADGSIFEVQQRIRGVDGLYRWHLVRALPVRDEGDRVSYWVGTSTNIDDQKRTEAALREYSTTQARLTRQLAERNRELDQFAYITSHDLKAPLRGIANLAQWIEEDLGEHATAEIRQQLELLRGRAHRMEALIDAILQYSRVGRAGDAPQQVDVGRMLDEVVDLLAPAPGAVRVEGAMPTILTERVPLQQTFHNLIGNSLKHGGPEVRVTVSSAEAGEFYAFTVADTGPGIAPQYHERIFGIFQTLASRDKVEGSGLGLALVKKIVETQGGTVTLDSDEGRGAAFTFTWPRESAPRE
jgi:PAS domain S-box-containing protein